MTKISSTARVFPIVDAGRNKARARSQPKGRRVDPLALAQVQSLLGDESRQADLLIEHLHKLQDHYGHLSAAHLAALAQEMRLPQAEVYEVATFYHHFDVVKEGEAAPGALTVRVCESLSCEMAGARALLNTLPKILGKDVRVLAVPCVGRCEQAPVVVVGQNPVPKATLETVASTVAKQEREHVPSGFIDYASYQAEGGYALLKDCVGGARDLEAVIQTMEDSG
ncbi:MAG: NAD(P)H-dependent oxidoreductase subunit E, partial [Betaproteobacteria bacterium]